MKTIGLIGGTSWHSTIDYYRIINELVNKKNGGNEAAQLILYSVNYGEIVKLTKQDNWGAIATIICGAAEKITAAGADCILLCANTMHNIADEVQKAVSVPLIHIATETGKAIHAKGLKKIGLIGTKYTMELGFYQKKLLEQGVETIIPDADERIVVNEIIYNELGKGLLLPESKAKYISVINNLIKAGAEGIALGCTEIPLLIKQEDSTVPVFDTTAIHAAAAVEFALS